MEIRHPELKGLNLDYLTIDFVFNGRVKEVKGYYYGGRRTDLGKIDGYNVYDLRETDDGECDIASIKDFVLVNHYGTFITKEVIDCIEDLPVTWWSFDPWEDPKYWDKTEGK